MRRRTFISGVSRAAGVAAGLTIARHTGLRAAPLPEEPARNRLRSVGLELYAVREPMRANPERTLADVKAMGYDYVELLWSFDNFGRTPAQVKATLANVGLRAPSAHIAPEILLDNWERRLDDARLLGHEYLIVPSLPAETDKSLDGWKKWADHFNTAGATARKAGVWLAFHNEPGHQAPLDGQIPYEVFVARTDPRFVRLQLDVGNLTMGGGDPMSYLTRYRDRYFSFHVKDVTADRTHDVELGRGTIDFRKFLAAIPGLAGKPVYVEQEGTEGAMDAARRNCTYIKALDF